MFQLTVSPQGAKTLRLMVSLSSDTWIHGVLALSQGAQISECDVSFEQLCCVRVFRLSLDIINVIYKFVIALECPAIVVRGWNLKSLIYGGGNLKP